MSVGHEAGSHVVVQILEVGLELTVQRDDDVGLLVQKYLAQRRADRAAVPGQAGEPGGAA